MANPDSFIPLYGDEFFQAIKGHPDTVGIGYLRAIWHYWSHNHCKGLRNDSEVLRRICEIDKSEWESAQAIIFDNDHFFAIGEDGLWHQKRASILWNASKEIYDKNVKRTAGARASTKKRWSEYRNRNL